MTTEQVNIYQNQKPFAIFLHQEGFHTWGMSPVSQWVFHYTKIDCIRSRKLKLYRELQAKTTRNSSVQTVTAKPFQPFLGSCQQKFPMPRGGWDTTSKDTFLLRLDSGCPSVR